jgi:hypothetical protein
MSGSAGQRIFTMTLASVYPLYLAKVEQKGRPGASSTRWSAGCAGAQVSRGG